MIQPKMFKELYQDINHIATYYSGHNSQIQVLFTGSSIVVYDREKSKNIMRITTTMFIDFEMQYSEDCVYIIFPSENAETDISLLRNHTRATFGISEIDDSHGGDHDQVIVENEPYGYSEAIILILRTFINYHRKVSDVDI